MKQGCDGGVGSPASGFWRLCRLLCICISFYDSQGARESQSATPAVITGDCQMNEPRN